MPRTRISSIESLRETIEKVETRVQTAGYSLDLEPAIQELYDACTASKWDEGIVRMIQCQLEIALIKKEMLQAQDWYERSLKLAEKKGLEQFVLSARCWKARTYINQGNLREGFLLAKEILTDAEKWNNQFYIANSKFYLGVVSQRYSVDDDALTYFKDVIKITRNNEHLKLEASTFYYLSELFLTRNEYSSAEKNAIEYTKIQTILSKPSDILRGNIRLASILLETGKLEEVEALLSSISKSTDALYSDDKGTLLLCNAKLAAREKDFTEAKKLFAKANKYFTALGDSRLSANSFAIVCEMYLEIKDTKEAVHFAKKTLELIDPEQDDYLATQAYRLMYESSKLANDASNALKYLELYNDCLKKHEEQLLRTRIQFIELHSEYEVKQAEFRSERRRSEELQITLEYKEKELTQKTRHLIKQTESLTQFRSDLKAIIRKVPGNDPLVDQVKYRIQSIPESQIGWEDFDKQFTDVHPVFLANLEKKFPLLTNMEKKISSLLRLGLTSIDIAKLLYLSERNIENHRYRIRKKFQIDASVNLQDFIARI